MVRGSTISALQRALETPQHLLHGVQRFKHPPHRYVVLVLEGRFRLVFSYSFKQTKNYKVDSFNLQDCLHFYRGHSSICNENAMHTVVLLMTAAQCMTWRSVEWRLDVLVWAKTGPLN